MTRLPNDPFPPEAMTKPPCPHFDECGACQYQHVLPDAYRQWKENDVLSLIEQNGLKPEKILPSVFVGAGTRRRVTFVARRDGDELVIGFHKYHETAIAPVESCLLLTPTLDRVYRKLKGALMPLLPRGGQIDILLQEADAQQVDCLITGMTERDEARLGAKQTAMVAEIAQLCDLRRVSFRKDEFSPAETQIELEKMTKTSGGIKVELPVGAFLQPSVEGEAAICDAVIAGLGKINKKDKVLDLFSGCGTFAGRIVEHCSVHAVENDWGMSQALKQAAKGNSRMTAEVRDLFKEPVSIRELRGYSAAVFDPPRAGAKEQAQKLAKSEIPLLIAVSCHPATFARDAKMLVSGGYQFKSLQVFDQFPYTSHTEIVGVFTKSA